jgi:hypothetical protein
MDRIARRLARHQRAVVEHRLGQDQPALWRAERPPPVANNCCHEKRPACRRATARSPRPAPASAGRSGERRPFRLDTVEHRPTARRTPRSDGSAASGPSRGCASISCRGCLATSSRDPNNSPSRAKKSPPSGRRTSLKCALSSGPARRQLRRGILGQFGRLPSITTSITSRSWGKAASIARSCLRQSIHRARSAPPCRSSCRTAPAVKTSERQSRQCCEGQRQASARAGRILCSPTSSGMGDRMRSARLCRPGSSQKIAHLQPIACSCP